MCVTRFLSLILVCIVGIKTEDHKSLSCPASTTATTHSLLKSHILCNYDATIRPVVNHQNATALTFRLIMKYFTYEDATGTLQLDAWMRLDWTDQHLTWNPEDFDSINSIILDTYEIWTPDLSVYNRAVQGGDPTVLVDTKCVISNKGGVKCVPSVHIDTLCVPDLRMYPLDTQACSLRMGSWMHKGEELDIKLLKDMVYMSSMEPNGAWEITSYTQQKFKGKYQNVTYPSIEIIFNIKRLAGAHVANVIIPTIVVTMITITTLCMSPTNKDRLTLCYVNLLVQFIHVQYLSWELPMRGDNVPNLHIFARDSLLLSAFAVLFTICFRNLMNRESPPPEWIRSIVTIAVATRPGQFIILNDYSVRGIAYAKGEEDGAGIVNPDENKPRDWKILGRILDILLLWAYSIAYLIMSMKFIP